MLQYIFILVLLATIYLSVSGIFKPGYALALVWSTYTLEQFLQHSHPFFVANGKLVNFGVIGVAALSLFYLMLKGKLKWLKLSRPHMWWASLIILAAISYFWSVSPTSTFAQLKTYFPYIVGFCIIAPYCATDEKQINIAINTTIYFGGLLLFGMLFCNFGARSVILVDTAYETLTGNPLAVATFGGYVAICSIFSIYANSKKTLSIFIKLIIAGIALYAIVRSGSRGQVIAVALSCMIWLPLTAQMAVKNARLFAVAAVIMVVVGAVYFVQSDDHLSMRWSSASMRDSQFGRFSMASQMIGEAYDAGPFAWLFGIGNSTSFKFFNTYPHVVPGEIIAEEGIVGFVFFMGCVLTAGIPGFRVLRLKSCSRTTRVNMGAMMSLFTFQIILSFKQGSMLGSVGLFSIALCIGLVAERILATKRREQRVVMPIPHSHSVPQHLTS